VTPNKNTARLVSFQTIPQAIPKEVPSPTVLAVCLKRTRRYLRSKGGTTIGRECIGHRFKIRGNNYYMMNYTKDIPAHRKHSNTQCNCRQCKQFDYADTSVLSVELIRAIDSETWERHYYCMPASRKPRLYNKYQRQ
jgi:hypothetical protein